MQIPNLMQTKRKTIRTLIEWKGLNRRAFIADNELADCTNLSSEHYPLISPRPPRKVEYTLTTGHALFAGKKLAWVDGTDFKYDGATKGSVTAGAKYIVDFNGKLCIFPDKKYYKHTASVYVSFPNDIEFGTASITSTSGVFAGVQAGDVLTITGCTVNTSNNKTFTVVTATPTIVTAAASTFTAGAETGTITFTETLPETLKDIGTGTYPADGSCPDIDYACVWDNRIWGVKGDMIYATSLGAFDDWTSDIGTTGIESWNTSTGTPGDFTGIVQYRDSVYAFKKNLMLKLVGDTALNFQFLEVTNIGCIAPKSIVEVNNRLFFLGERGVYMYTGGIPELISINLDESYVSAVAGGDNRRYYLSLYNGTAYNLYVYDTFTGTWLKEDNLNVKEFALYNSNLYALVSDNKIYKFNDGTETVTSTAVTKEFTENIVYKKGLSQINVRCDLESGAKLTVYLRINNGNFVAVKSNYATTDLQSFVIPIKVERADHYQLKFEMVGKGKIHAVERIYQVGSDY